MCKLSKLSVEMNKFKSIIVGLKENNILSVVIVSEKWMTLSENAVYYPTCSNQFKIEKALRSHEEPYSSYTLYECNVRNLCGMLLSIIFFCFYTTIIYKFYF